MVTCLSSCGSEFVIIHVFFLPQPFHPFSVRFFDVRFLSARCKYYFDSMLAQRGYTGSMTFDHKNETLSISVRVTFYSKFQKHFSNFSLLKI